MQELVPDFHGNGVPLGDGQSGIYRQIDFGVQTVA
jgi:hypothetical protein